MENTLNPNWLEYLVMMVKSGGGTDGRVGRSKGGSKGNNEITQEIQKNAQKRTKGVGFGSDKTKKKK